jgi:hypothetical protein
MTSIAADHGRLGAAFILLAVALSFALSVTLWFTGRHDEGVFVGLWVPSILSLASFLRPTPAR